MGDRGGRRVTDRYATSARRGAATADLVGAIGDAILRYEVATGTARHWHPMAAVADASGAATLEQRAIHPATGTMLAATQPLQLHEEELPGEVRHIERTFQLARWSRGRTVVCHAGRTGGSGPCRAVCAFDDVRRPPAEPS